MKKRMMKICYMMTLAAVLCTSGTIGATGIKSVYAAENEVQGRAATTNGILIMVLQVLRSKEMTDRV